MSNAPFDPTVEGAGPVSADGMDQSAAFSGQATVHVQGQSAPTAAGLRYPFAGAQPQLAADEVHLGHLCLFQGQLRPRVVGAGAEQTAVQPQTVKLHRASRSEYSTE